MYSKILQPKMYTVKVSTYLYYKIKNIYIFLKLTILQTPDSIIVSNVYVFIIYNIGG